MLIVPSQAPLMDAGQLQLSGKCGKLEGPPGSTASLHTEASIIISLYGSPSLKADPNLAFLFPQEGSSASSKRRKTSHNAVGEAANSAEEEEEPAEDEEFLAQQAIERAKARRRQRAEGAFDSFFGESARDVAHLPTCPQPSRSRVKTRLLRHQLQALRWMAEMEHPRPRRFTFSLFSECS